jgi:mono/diheme cytochrome c family protein
MKLARMPALTAQQQIGVTTMKRIILLASVISFAAALTAGAADGKALWDHHCAMCHGADGKGQTNMGKKLGAKDYTDPKVQAALTDEAATKAIKDGFKNEDGKTVMRPAKNLSDDQIKDLVAYMRTFKK